VQEWSSLAEGSPDLIARIDKKGIFLLANREIAGFTREKAIGTILYDYLPEGIRKEVRSKLRDAIGSGEERRFISSGIGQVNAPGMFECRIIPLKSKGKVIAVTFTARSIPKKKR
jgi:PAS domain S-box-containing protein